VSAEHPATAVKPKLAPRIMAAYRPSVVVSVAEWRFVVRIDV